MRTSRADREPAIDTLKVAYVQGRLTKDELDERLGRALAPLTHAELAALTGDLPDELATARRPRGDGQSKARLKESSAAKAGMLAASVAGLAVVESAAGAGYRVAAQTGLDAGAGRPPTPALPAGQTRHQAAPAGADGNPALAPRAAGTHER
jgi:hypothetical protein